MRDKFNSQLKKLNRELVEMGNLICQAIDMAVDALDTGNLEEAGNAIEFDMEIDHKERDIERSCMKLLLTQQPVAGDLRLISSALKMITDMERIGDQAADISEINISVGPFPGNKMFSLIQRMATITTDMVRKSIKAFVERDRELAVEIIERDDEVDGCFDSLKEEVIRSINKNEEHSEKAVDALMIGKYFERIGDHATNIADWAAYSIGGQHAKTGSKE